jgi:DNA polymerase-1
LRARPATRRRRRSICGLAKAGVSQEETLLIIDVYALVYRAFFALPPLTTSSGRPVNAAYGFQRMLQRVLREENPTHVVACFDAGIPEERLVAVPAYKAQRPEMPDELRPQFDTVRRILDAYGIPVVEVEGEEADDCIATIVSLAEQRNLRCTVLSGDLDLLQLVSPHCTVVVTKRGISDLVRYDEAAVRERFGLAPAQLPDFRGLKGDPSDNLPGVPGIGEKTAAKLIAQFGSLDNLLAHLDEVRPPRIADLLRNHADLARACRDVSRAKRTLPIQADWDAWRYRPPSPERLAALYQELEFKSLLATIATPAFAAAGDGEPVEPATEVFTPGTYRMADAADTALEVLRQAAAQQELALVPVPPIASWRTQTPLGLALAWRPGEAAIIPAALVEAHSGVREALRLVGGPAGPAWLVFDAKNTAGWLNRHGILAGRIAFDAMLAAGLLDPARGEPTLAQALDKTPGAQAPLPAPDAARHLFDGQRPDSAWAAAADAILRAAPVRLATIRELGLERVLLEIEQPLGPVLAQMEAVGFRLDLAELDRIRDELTRDIEETTREIYRLAGEEFNLNSPKALGGILFEKLGLPASGRKTKTGYATGAEILAPLAHEHPIAAALLRYRELSKLKSTYVDALPALIDPVTGRLHTTFHQLGAATGRLSSSDPNLQNIPVRSAAGRAIRRAFLPAGDGHLLLAADYSQIELRIVAHLSGDERFIEAFRRGDDIHAFTAREVFAVAPGEPVPPELRRRAKAVNFGILYGQGEAGLAAATGMTRAQAREFIAAYFARFPNIKAYVEASLTQARERGYVTTLFGRRRYLPDIRSRVHPVRAAAERMAVNAPAQGTAADLIKLAMVAAARAFATAGIGAQLVLQVHDELIAEVPPQATEIASRAVREAMTGVAELVVPLVVDEKLGPTWADAEPIA